MQIPVPGVQSPVGIGHVVAAAISAFTGVAPCPACQARANWLNRLLTFIPTKKG